MYRQNPAGPEFKTNLIQSYLEAKAELEGAEAESVSEEDVKKYLWWTKLCLLVSDVELAKGTGSQV